MKALLIQHPAPRTTFVVPLGLGYLAAILKKRGVSVKIIDATAPYAQYNNLAIAKMLEKEHFDLIGITITTLFANFAYELMEVIAKNKHFIVCGGPHVSLFPHEALLRGAKVSVVGEGEAAISEIADYLKGERNLEDIPGISYIDRTGAIIDNPARPLIDNLDSLPFPDKEAFNFDDYAQDKIDTSKFGSILSSRGCPGRCVYCSKAVFGARYRFRSPENIILEMNSLHEHYGLDHFSFLDDTVTLNSKNLFALCNVISNQKAPKYTWSCSARIDLLNAEALKAMQLSGCVHINYGIESANPDTLRRIKKDISPESIESTVALTKDCGIDYSINFIWGYPWESAGEIENSINFMKKLGRRASWINPGGILMPFPGTPIYDEFKEAYGFKDWWLDKFKFTGSYRLRTTSPLFRYFFFEDLGLLETGGFFNYSRSVKQKIKKAVRYIGNFNLKNQPFVYYVSGKFIIWVSRVLYGLSPNLELIWQKFFFFILRIKRSGKKNRRR